MFAEKQQEGAERMTGCRERKNKNVLSSQYPHTTFATAAQQGSHLPCSTEKWIGMWQTTVHDTAPNFQRVLIPSTRRLSFQIHNLSYSDI